MLTDLALPKAALLFPPLVVAESTYQGVRSSAFGEFLVQGAAALILVMLVWSFIERLRGGTAQKREVSFAEEFATKEQLRQAHGRMERERAEVDKELESLRTEVGRSTQRLADSLNALRLEIKQDNLGVHNRINEILEAVSELRGRIDAK